MNIKAVYTDGIDILYTKPIYQHEASVTLTIEGLPLAFPAIIDISNSKSAGNAVKYTTNVMPFDIPDSYFVSGEYVYVWIHASDRTILITIPVLTRPMPIDAPDYGDETSAYKYEEDDENLIMYKGLNGIISRSSEEDVEDETNTNSPYQDIEDLIRQNMEDE